MAHWLCIRTPQLPLEIFSRSGSEQQPLAVSHHGRRASVLLCNPAAQARGIRPGITLAAARALAQDLIVRPRDLKAERQALHGLAAWAYQFSAQVSLYPSYELLLEVQGSYRLFGGYEALVDKLQTGLAALGYEAGFASAPTPLSALSLARCNYGQAIDTPAQLASALAPLPVSVLDWEQVLLDRLDGMGIRRLGDLLRLPRAGLARRFGPKAVLYLDRMLGGCPHPQRLYQPPQVFERRLQLPADIEQAQALLFALQRLLLEMCGWLQGQGAAVQRVDIRLLHHEQDASCFSLGIYQPTRDADQLVALLRERIERLELQAPVHSVELHAGETVKRDAQSQDLFDRSDRSGQIDLLDRLRARLGDNAVTGLSAVAEHRPEYAWRYEVNCGAREGPLGGEVNCGARQGESPSGERRSPGGEGPLGGEVNKVRAIARESALGHCGARQGELRSKRGCPGAQGESPSGERRSPGGECALGHEVNKVSRRREGALGHKVSRRREGPPEEPLGMSHSSPSALGQAVPGDSTTSNNQRPLWLLPVPRKLKTCDGHPQLQGRLQLQSDCERIESGWWDEQDLARDYYIATNPSGSSYWIYRELTGERGWYLQGVFD